jgi:DivIVA domain-containing protein
MAVSISRPDPTSPASVAEAKFSTARRGYDHDEVRELLRGVAAELGRLQERERSLEHDLRTAQSRPFDGSGELDDETVARLLGEETLHVLQTARESASQIKIRAEEGAARILREATEDANRTREQAEIEASRKRADSAADAEAEVSLAKQQGREMVNEARAYRERVLSELARRREVARQQIEQLILGRDRLLQVFERARLVAVDVVAELSPLGEPEEYVDLSPTTGPVPMMVPARALAAAPGAPEADDTVAAEPVGDDTVATDTVAESPSDDDSGISADAFDAADTTQAPDRVDSPDPTDPTDEPELADETELAEPTEAVVAVDAASANVVSLFPGSSEGQGRADAGALFARLRADASTADTPPTAATTEHDVHLEAEAEAAAEADADVDVDVGAGAADETIFDRRDAALVPLIVAGARKLKRVLADEQNDVLDALRKSRDVADLATILPSEAEHAARYAAAIADELSSAAVAGAGTTGGGSPAVLRRSVGKSSVLDPVRSSITAELVRPLRDRLGRSVADGAGDNDDITKRVRAVYREWKTQHIDDQLDDVFRLAYGSGALAAAAPGTRLCWSVDPHGPPCPDAEDNALAGPVGAGDAYPTGHTMAPAHAGCRCVLAPASK